jgi:hypothetical protein
MTEEVKINPEAFEPHQYFAVLKENMKDAFGCVTWHPLGRSGRTLPIVSVRQA